MRQRQGKENSGSDFMGGSSRGRVRSGLGRTVNDSTRRVPSPSVIEHPPR